MSILINAINPILADLDIAKLDWVEFKAEADVLDIDISTFLSKKSELENLISEELSGNNAPARINALNNEILAVQTMLSESAVKRRALQSIVEIAEWYYISIENLLKSKIIEIQGSDALFSTHVPARPGIMSEAQPTPARRLAIFSAALDEYNRFYKEGCYRINRPLPTI